MIPESTGVYAHNAVDVISVIFGLQVIRDGVPQPVISSAVPLCTGTAVNVLCCTRYFVIRVFATDQILLGWKTYKYYYETDILPNPRPTQPKKTLG